MNTSTNSEMAQLYAALATAQGQFKAIEKNRTVEIAMKTGGKYRFRFADLEEILSKTRPALSANGLAILHRVEFTPEGQVLVCQLVHSGGGYINSSVQIQSAREMGDPKSFGAAVSYYRRYMITAMLGVAADDDLDENGQDKDTSKGAPANAGEDLLLFETKYLQSMRDAALGGSAALQTAFAAIPKGVLKTTFWTKHQAALKKAAAQADTIDQTTGEITNV